MGHRERAKLRGLVDMLHSRRLRNKPCAMGQETAAEWLEHYRHSRNIRVLQNAPPEIRKECARMILDGHA